METLIDVGSSTVKAYSYSGDELDLQDSKSFHFKDDFSPENGLSAEAEQELFNFINSVQDGDAYVFGTSIFRDMEEDVLERFTERFTQETGTEFNLITQEEENEYLEAALLGRYDTEDSVVLVNIGGGSTELVVADGDRRDRYNIDIGVGTIIEEFPEVNEETSNVRPEEITAFVNTHLPDDDTTIAFYTGGELTYMQRCDYPVRNNDLFDDSDHPIIIDTEDFREKNIEVFDEMTLQELKDLMPENPKWMEGARACSALAQAIFEKFGVETIVPSDSNMIDGIVRKELS